MSVAAIALCLLATEIYFRLFFFRSDNMGMTKPNHLWFKKYWHPINSLGYRDREWSPEDLSQKRVVAVVGDSFAAGHGIQKTQDRFGDVLGNLLGNRWAVVNIAQCGLHALVATPIRGPRNLEYP